MFKKLVDKFSYPFQMFAVYTLSSALSIAFFMWVLSQAS